VCQNYISNSEEDRQREFTATEKQVLSSSNKFGFNLFKSINQTDKDKNVFISPLSVSLALGMTMNGANGETYDEMRATLQFAGLTNEEINKSYKSLIETLYASDPKVTFTSANSIWYRNEMTFEQSFFDLSVKYFNALIKGLDFNNSASVGIINNWVKENTQNKIEKILESIGRGDVMYLINAIYFKGTWRYEFDKEETKPDEFILQNGEKISAEMMVQTNDYNYYSDEQLQAIELPYGDGNFSMIVLLPEEGTDINKFTEEINEGSLNSWFNNLTEQKGTLWLPKFKIEFDSELKDYLIALGMRKAFTSSLADFSNLYKGPDQLWIGKVIHKTFVEVDEEGTEAAAVTLVGIVRTSGGGDNGFFMKVNRPFLFLIKEKSSDCILFMGKIINPN
jgi:serine protease inhibitor